MIVKDFVKEGNNVTFEFYRQGYFYYKVRNDEGVFQFPIPLEDIGTATMLHQDKAIVFMRWIRKAIGEGTMINVTKTN